MGRVFLPKLVSVASAAVRPSALHIKDGFYFIYLPLLVKKLKPLNNQSATPASRRDLDWEY